MKQGPIQLVIAGAGSRGTGYADYARRHPERVEVVGVAEPRKTYRDRLVHEHRISPKHTFGDWSELASVPKFADAVAITTQDAMHVGPAVAFADLGYHILLEKPMAPNEADCIRITDAVKRNGVILAVGHVMRYTEYTTALKTVVASGAIGDIASVEHLEPVGYWHQAHSFVRGNWRNESDSSPMLLSKSCHDVDWLRYIVGRRCLKVSSFGSLLHFRRDRKPTEAKGASRCPSCEYEPRCAYSAMKLYLPRVRAGHTGWPIDILTPVHTEEAVMSALRTGPYGRCVYECDNDVVDHQVVTMLFDGGATASFTMTAFTESANRKTRIFGTKGMLEGDGRYIRRFDFLTDTWHETDTAATDGSISGGHGGGDYGLMTAFAEAVATGEQSRVLSGPEESLETHRMVFAAERARRAGTVEEL